MIAVSLKLPQDGITAMFTHSMMMKWLNDTNVICIKMKLDWELYPHTLLMEEEDAVAFKLKFGL
jgi:hypothetical protein